MHLDEWSFEDWDYPPMQHVVSGHLLPSGAALNFHVCARPTVHVCIFVRAVSRLVVGMLKGCCTTSGG